MVTGGLKGFWGCREGINNKLNKIAKKENRIKVFLKGLVIIWDVLKNDIKI
jgi:hypothetical protein